MSLASELFPDGIVSYETERTFEVNGLKKNSIPQYCDILDSASEHMTNGDRREYFFVLTRPEFAITTQKYVMLRVCTAMPGSGYEEYAVCHGICDHSDEGASAFAEKQYRRMILLRIQQRR